MILLAVLGLVLVVTVFVLVGRTRSTPYAFLRGYVSKGNYGTPPQTDPQHKPYATEIYYLKRDYATVHQEAQEELKGEGGWMDDKGFGFCQWNLPHTVVILADGMIVLSDKDGWEVREVPGTISVAVCDLGD
ncbi:MAG: hypothetical protein M9921_05680 [Fimbriimonadaceae bacterium]|nr:hypothetical protein [Fimbriimonadaceae bacterium]